MKRGDRVAVYVPMIVVRCVNECAGVKRGDRVAVYMPMIVEMVVTLLACARLGVIHSVVVSAYSHATHNSHLNVINC